MKHYILYQFIAQVHDTIINDSKWRVHLLNDLESKPQMVLFHNHPCYFFLSFSFIFSSCLVIACDVRDLQQEYGHLSLPSLIGITTVPPDRSAGRKRRGRPQWVKCISVINTGLLKHRALCKITPGPTKKESCHKVRGN